MTAPVGIIMGSASDSETMNYCVEVLEEERIPFDIIVASAHRDPDKVYNWVVSAEGRGNKIIIAAAGMAAALPGMCAAYTSLPVIGVPMTSELNGMDSLLSISQMPRGVPVACMSIGKHGAVNAALFAKRILDSSKVSSYTAEDRYVKPGDHDQDLWRDD
ncbi:MAG: 5-(carboxyamino)imidazole ribonucleotide mutase [Anaerolineales bacterium]|jgi:5-(carboxyamino)imidazole ribonucleotide mutase|nr:5-(carboxyamino)imidazole ribonucleotide mutase [Anaerolineales bacterium]